MIWERIVADGGDAAGEGHARQTSAIIERPVADGGDAVGDRDARQSTTASERRVADGRHWEAVDSGWDSQGTGC